MKSKPKGTPAWFWLLHLVDLGLRENSTTRKILKVVEGSNHAKNNRMAQNRKRRAG